MSAASISDASLAELTALLDAAERGQSLDWFVRMFKSLCMKDGWSWFANVPGIEFRRRARILYVATSRSRCARTRRAQLAAGSFSFLVFSSDPHCAPEHLALDGLALPADHPFWQLCQPPLCWDCGCALSGARSANGVARLGGRPDKLLPNGWEQALADKSTLPGTHPNWTRGCEPSLRELLAMIASGAIGTEKEA